MYIYKYILYIYIYTAFSLFPPLSLSFSLPPLSTRFPPSLPLSAPATLLIPAKIASDVSPCI